MRTSGPVPVVRSELCHGCGHRARLDATGDLQSRAADRMDLAHGQQSIR
jgi:hypothetical protein